MSPLPPWSARQQQRGRQDHYSFPVELHGRSGKVRASLLPPKEHSRHSRNTTAGTLGIIPATSMCTTAGTFKNSTCLSKCKNGRNVSATPLQSLILEKHKSSTHHSNKFSARSKNALSLISTHSLPESPPTIQTHYHKHTHSPMPKLPPPYRPDFEAETALPIELIQASWLAFLTTTLALLLGCFLIFLLRLSVIYDRQLAREGFVGGVPREEKILRRCEERGRRVCRERGIWDVGVRGGPLPRDCEVGSVDEKRRGKKLRFLPVPEVIPPEPAMGDDSTPGNRKDKGKGKERQRTRSHSSHIGSGLRRSDDWGTCSMTSVAGVTAARRASSMTLESGEWAWPSQRRASADWVRGGEEPVLFFGAGSWIGRVRNRSETRSGSVMEGRALGERDGNIIV